MIKTNQSNYSDKTFKQVFYTPKTLSQLPSLPGIYKMLDDTGAVLYIGKAKLLKNRVRSYFNREHPDRKTAVLVRQISFIDIMVTQTEEEALILERQLIAKFRPHFNIALKDDKNYPFLKLSKKDPFPRVLIARKRVLDDAWYFGPYPSIGSTHYLVKLINDLFPIRDCKQDIDLVKRQPKCINLDIGKCIGPCVNKQTKPEYDEWIIQLRLFLSGQNAQLLSEMTQKMKLYSQKLQFEKAAALRDKMATIQRLNAKQIVETNQGYNADIWSVIQAEGYGYILVQTIVEGKLLYQKGGYTKLTQLANANLDPNEDPMADLLRTYAESHYFNPPATVNEILVDAQWQSIFTSLQEAGVMSEKTTIVVPKIGDKRKQLTMAKKNAELALGRVILHEMKTAGFYDQLAAECQRALSLNKPPYRIIGFDISHLQGTDIVASAVMFDHGKPIKKDYRKFNIKSVSGQSNDPASMFEVVSRRLNRIAVHKEPVPDLLLIDGGKAQLNFAKKALDQSPFKDKIELVGLAKREEELVLTSGKIVHLTTAHSVTQLFQRVRDEAHRFAVTFQRTKRKKSIQSQLSDIPGLGPKRVAAVYAAFKTISAIKSADVQALAAVSNIGLKLAQEIQKRVE